LGVDKSTEDSGMRRLKLATGVAVAALLIAQSVSAPLRADTIEAALVRAYQTNPQLNAQRAQVRVTDENVPQALSGYRPKISVAATAGTQYSGSQTIQPVGGGAFARVGEYGVNAPRTVTGTITQTLFNGQQTANRTRAAESQVSAAREGLRVLEQSVLLAAATIYMDYLRDAAIVEVQRSNTRVLEQTLKQTQDRFNVGEVTRTDVAQSEAQLAAGRTQQLTAESNLVTTKANFRRIIGNEPVNLDAASPVDRFLPGNLLRCIDVGLLENPNVTAAMYGIDVSFLNVKVAEGALFPTVALQGQVQQANETTLATPAAFSATAAAQISIPIYQGGSEYSLIRQSKETLAQQRLNLEQVRDQTRATVAQAWGQLQAAKAQVSSAQSQVTASETALNGVREEARVGQRTTLDVLNAQQALVNARVALVTAQHDRVVASYSTLNSVGRLEPEVLHLRTNIYDPRVHYQQVRDSWIGVRIPDGQ
jgi:outer membrane protein